MDLDDRKVRTKVYIDIVSHLLDKEPLSIVLAIAISLVSKVLFIARTEDRLAIRQKVNEAIDACVEAADKHFEGGQKE